MIMISVVSSERISVLSLTCVRQFDARASFQALIYPPRHPEKAHLLAMVLSVYTTSSKSHVSVQHLSNYDKDPHFGSAMLRNLIRGNFPETKPCDCHERWHLEIQVS